MTPSRQAKKKPNPLEKPLFTVGVLADTHIPDRVGELHPLILPYLRENEVTHIFHAGDICSRGVIAELQGVAPVTAVRGNRDWFVPELPLVSEIDLGGVHIALMHGHGGIWRYLLDKVRFLTSGYKLRRYLKLLTQTVSGAQVVVFGHTHFPEKVWLQDKLLFNPGSASFGAKKGHMPTMGFLRIFENGRVQPSIVRLRGYRIEKRRWVQPTGTQNP